MIVILDGNSIAYRAYHKAPPLTAPDGTPTGAVHLFFTIVERVRSQLKPSKIIATFDSAGKTSRHEKYEEYKATRDAMPEDLAPQIQLINELLPLAGIEVYKKTGVEADDIIATIACRSEEPVVIVTKDKDLFQLVNDNIKIFDDQTGTLMGAKEAFNKYGVTPEQMLSYLSLIGDKSDNIPGVQGIGEKTACKLIQEYKDLDNIYAHIEDLKGKLKENLLRDKDNAYRAKELIALETIDPLFEPVYTPDREELRARLSDLGMRTIANKLLAQPTSTTGAEGVIEPEEVLAPLLPPFNLSEVKSPEYFLAIDGDLWVADTENSYETYNPERHTIDKNSVFYDVKAFAKTSGKPLGMVKDYLLISWLCEPDNGTIRKGRAEPMEQFIPRFIQAIAPLDEKLKKLQLENIYANLEIPIAYILADMENTGIKIDPERVRKVANQLKQQISVVASRMITRAGYEINLNSPKQVSEYLYNRLEIPPLSKKNTSTAEEVLRELMVISPEHKDILEDILTYREYSKLLSTYTQPLLDARAEDGRIHTTFKQTGTGTGRLSSANPNLQNIPTRGEAGTTIRDTFVADTGYVFVTLDYSQIELRLLAHMSDDKTLKDAFKNNYDIHTITAMKIFNKTEHEVDADLRRLAKAVNFGILYGLSAYGLSRDTGVTPRVAKEFIEAYFDLYQGIRNYIDTTIEFTHTHGYCETLLGRKRFFPDINSRNALNRQRAERAAMNAPLQGTASDIIKLAMIRCNHMIRENNTDARLLLQIHDELLFEVKEEQAENFLAAASREMQSAFTLDVPLEVNCSIGCSWGELK